MSLYSERLDDGTIQWCAILRYQMKGRIDGLESGEDIENSERWLRALREVQDAEKDDDVLLYNLVQQYFKLLYPNSTARQRTPRVNGWFKKDEEDGFKVWANNRAVTTNGDKQLLAELDSDLMVRNVIIRLCPESEFVPQEVEGGGFMGYIHKSRLTIEQLTEEELAGASLVQEARVQESETEVLMDTLIESSSDDADDSTLDTFRNEVNDIHEDPPRASNSKESLLLDQIEVLKRRLKESELLV